LFFPEKLLYRSAESTAPGPARDMPILSILDLFLYISTALRDKPLVISPLRIYARIYSKLHFLAY